MTYLAVLKGAEGAVEAVSEAEQEAAVGAVDEVNRRVQLHKHKPKRIGVFSIPTPLPEGEVEGAGAEGAEAGTQTTRLTFPHWTNTTPTSEASRRRK